MITTAKSAASIMRALTFAWIAASGIGCHSATTVAEASAMGSAYVSTLPLRADQISLRGPLTISNEDHKTRDFAYQYAQVPAADPLVEELNAWARKRLVGARVSLVSYAPRLYVRGENFSLNFAGESIVINLWEGRESFGQWAIELNTENDPLLAEIKARLASWRPRAPRRTGRICQGKCFRRARIENLDFTRFTQAFLSIG